MFIKVYNFDTSILLGCLVMTVVLGCKPADRVKKNRAPTTKLTSEGTSTSALESKNQAPDDEYKKANLAGPQKKLPYENLFREFVAFQDQMDYENESEFLPVYKLPSPAPMDLTQLKDLIVARDKNLALPAEVEEALRVGQLRPSAIFPFVFCTAQTAFGSYQTKLKNHDFFTKKREPSVFTERSPFPDMVKLDAHWRNGWIPIASNEASIIFVDLDPGPEGEVMQVVLFDQSEFGLKVLSPSLKEFFGSLEARTDDEETEFPYLEF